MSFLTVGFFLFRVTSGLMTTVKIHKTKKVCECRKVSELFPQSGWECDVGPQGNISVWSMWHRQMSCLIATANGFLLISFVTEHAREVFAICGQLF